MNAAFQLLSWSEWLALLLHFLGLSLMTIGGAMVTAPDMHRYLVQQHGWITESQFTASIAIAQAAPGPNILFVALLGWHVGINAGSLPFALLGAGLTLGGLVLPSTVMAYFAGRWAHRNRHLRIVRAFKLGLGPVVISLMMSTGWIMASAHDDPQRDWKLWLVMLLTFLLVWRTRVSLLWLLGAGALAGGLGWL